MSQQTASVWRIGSITLKIILIGDGLNGLFRVPITGGAATSIPISGTLTPFVTRTYIANNRLYYVDTANNLLVSLDSTGGDRTEISIPVNFTLIDVAVNSSLIFIVGQETTPTTDYKIYSSNLDGSNSTLRQNLGTDEILGVDIGETNYGYAFVPGAGKSTSVRIISNDTEIGSTMGTAGTVGDVSYAEPSEFTDGVLTFNSDTVLLAFDVFNNDIDTTPFTDFVSFTSDDDFTYYANDSNEIRKADIFTWDNIILLSISGISDIQGIAVGEITS